MTTLLAWQAWCETMTDEQYRRMWPMIDALCLLLTEKQELHVIWTLIGLR